MILREEAKVGTKVISLIDFVGVSAGSLGLIVEDYGTGVMVEWQGIKAGLGERLLRDGFDKTTELRYLELA